MMRTWLDLGHDHQLAFYAFAPNRELNPQYAGVPDYEKAGAVVRHRKPNGERCDATVVGGDDWCSGSIPFDLPGMRGVDPHAKAWWRVEQWEPLTLSPSLLCACGDHGFVRGGRWVPA